MTVVSVRTLVRSSLGRPKMLGRLERLAWLFSLEKLDRLDRPG